MLANGATIIYWNRGDGEKVTGKKGLSDGFQIVVIFWRRNVRRRPSLAALFSQTPHAAIGNVYPSAAVAPWKLGREGLPVWSKGYPDE
jgi:hypothetical protein